MSSFQFEGKKTPFNSDIEIILNQDYNVDDDKNYIHCIQT